MIRLKMLDSYYRIIDGYDIRESSREVKFSSLKVDFTNKTISDLPKKYQEVQLLDLDDEYNVNEIIYTGYINNFILPKMKNTQEFRELEIDLISPLAMATFRTVDAVGTYNLQSLINELVMPLISDGFVLKEMNVGNNEITVNFLAETIESALNKLSNRFNFWWYIDRNKNIYINSIEYLIAKKPKLIYDDDNKIDGLIDVIPSIDATDYCNVVDFNNLRLFTFSRIDRMEGIDPNTSETIYYYKTYNPITEVREIKTGDEIKFDIPFDITISNYLKVKNTFSTGTVLDKIFYLSYFEDDVTQIENISIEFQNNQLVVSNNISIEDNYSENNEWILVRDVFFKNLIVGLKYNGTNDVNIYSLSCINALMWTKIRVINNDEVYKNKGIISNTGIIEKQINMGEQWKFYDEIVDIANSYIKKNNSRIEQVVLNIDEENDIDIGDTIKINKPSFLIDDIYIVTDKNIMFESNVKIFQFTLKNTNILENYVDLFRAKETEEPSEKQFYLITSNYTEESMKEVYEVSEI